MLLLLIGSLTFTVVNAQDGSGELVSKKGFAILPEAGDIGLGINAVPVFGYFGNMMNGTAGNNISYNFVNGTNTIYGKYYLDATTAVRARIRLAKASTFDKEYVIKDLDVPDPLALVEDIYQIKSCNVQLGAGYELRRGKGRLQGFYGGEVLISYATGGTNYIYGNNYSPDFTTPSTTDFGTNITANGRVQETKTGKTVGMGLRAFIGTEYFFAPKISVAGEFGWGFAYVFTGRGEVTEESWNGTEIKTTVTKDLGGKGYNLDTDNLSGAIALIFHF
ncbi:MAG: hypothetical protein A2W91_15360 [Bacteroidetes bacterium GWF2_38_335]|nr:MAG: hypothetical protein A2W91_15360 [Bacteroidetes bacterium GWF2_38_335]OFY81044.1 MAG: hypothetical protein A2281_13120 [Bacteroidetes bacterium RIFOXYA12_FULL_38_20]HBS87640.1 hypothetical protein [Bacteroidales bacterium]